MITPIKAFWSSLENHGDRTALIGSGHCLTYRSLVAEAEVWTTSARTLLPMTVTRPLVALEMPRSIAAITAYVGCLRAGWPVILLAEAEADRHSAILTTFAPNLVVTGPDATPTLADPTQAAFCDDLAVLLSTSGTTGASKLVKLSATNLHSNARAIVEYLGVRPDDTTITTLPLHYSYGMSVLHTHLFTGARLVISDAALTDPDFWSLARQHDITSLALVPTQFEVLKKTAFDDATLPRLRYMTQAGGRLDADIARHFAQRAGNRGWQIFLMYGQTEAAPRMAYLPPNLAGVQPDGIGQAIPGGRLWIEDPNGQKITTPHTAGELVYQGPNVMIGYAQTRADLATPRMTDILRTGDIAQQDGTGLFRIVGRQSRFVKLNGLRIGLDDVERTLRQDGHRVLASGDDTGIVLFVDGPTGTLAADLATRFGLMQSQVHATSLTDPPLLSSGKVDHARLRLMAADIIATAAPNPDGRGLSDTLTKVLRTPDINPDLTFRDLGGDSLAYLEVELFLMKTYGHVPDNWDETPIAILEGRLTTAAPKTRVTWQSIGIDVPIRVFAIIWVIMLHTTPIGNGGGVFALTMLIGHSLARHQRLALQTGRVWRVLDAMLRPILVAYFALLVLMLAKFDISWKWFALIANFPAAFDRIIQPDLFFPYWFVAAYAQVILLVALLFLLRPVRTQVAKDPFRAGLVATAVLTVILAFLPDFGLGARLIRLPHGMLQLVGIGWCVAFAVTRRQKLAALGLIFGSYLLVWLETGITVQEAILGTPLLLLLVPRVRLPALMARALMQLGALSLYIYLLHVPAIYVDWYFFHDTIGLFLSTVVVSVIGAFVMRSLFRRLANMAQPRLARLRHRGQPPLQPAPIPPTMPLSAPVTPLAKGPPPNDA